MRYPFEIGYFRKVNFLVSFFKDRGLSVENNTPAEITLGDAKELLSRCNEVLEDHNKAEKLLPTTEGFFFGSTEYDDRYFKDVQEVRDFVETELIPEFDMLDRDEVITFDISY